MAEIDLQKKRNGIWPWLLAALVLVVAVVAALALMNDDETEFADVPIVEEPLVPVVVDPPGADGTPAQLSTFISDCTRPEGVSAEDMSRAHDFTVQCLEKLRGSIDGVIAGNRADNGNVSSRMDGFTTAVDRLRNSEATAGNHAALVRDAATTAASVIDAAATDMFAGADQIATAAQEVEQSANVISTDSALLEQRDALLAFFRESGEALTQMAQAPQQTT